MFVVVVVMELYFKLIDLWLLPNIPGKKSDAFAEPADIILSLVGTASLGFNIFLGKSSVKEKVVDLIQSLTCEVGVLFFDISFIATV